uniref:Uncharacterized protein n=1 Tax=Rhizochromulina marina TaxID=1034831 RepID=A0A6U1AK03_9STRA|eukprot:CAMPEP_0118971350 /NCGR_PEP_ID=MMETSP1173-20130426/7999_1 /TAXON_ID=1034831 /ORGANISM="Rhizochromulina marina cf, Strain CCMP1243" /LENGTH=304 /DNA_ID=CAMNT_0006920795 /DNA_START=442 /DNA_END=1356 /DNA_ORIENTATION=+
MASLRSLCVAAAVAAVFVARDSSAFTAGPGRLVMRHHPRAWVTMSSETVSAQPTTPVANAVPPVSVAIQKFNELYSKPIIPMYRALINDLIVTTHLTVVRKDFQYNQFFGLGMQTIYESFFTSYPEPGAAKDIFDAILGSLNLDPAVVAADTKAVLEWADGKTEAAVLASIDAPEGSAIAETMAAVKANEKFIYSRVFAIGVFKVMGKVGLDTISEDDLERWFSAMNITTGLIKSDYDLFNGSIERMRDAEQMFKEIEIREKKKLADRLEKKAKSAAEAAAKKAQGVSEEDDEDAPTEQQSAEI